MSTNSGLWAGELLPAVHIGSKSLVVITHALYSSPAFTVTFGNVATYSTRWLLPPSASLELEFNGTTYGASESKNFTLESSPLFTITIAIISPFDLSTPNIVMITLNTSDPLPVSAWAGFIVILTEIVDVITAPIRTIK